MVDGELHIPAHATEDGQKSHMRDSTVIYIVWVLTFGGSCWLVMQVEHEIVSTHIQSGLVFEGQVCF